jgi:hypothetical protein
MKEMENIGPPLFRTKKEGRLKMNINYKDMVRWRGKATADEIYDDYKSGKIKTMNDLLVYYGIGKKGGEKKV